HGPRAVLNAGARPSHEYDCACTRQDLEVAEGRRRPLQGVSSRAEAVGELGVPARLPYGSVREAENYEGLFGELPHEPYPTRTLQFKGQVVPAPRRTLRRSALEVYQPKNAERFQAEQGQRTRFAFGTPSAVRFPRRLISVASPCARADAK